MTAQVTVGVDGSDESLAATRWAAGEAVLREVPLLLVHVEEWPSTPEAPLPDSRQLDARAEALLENEADRVRREHPGLDVLVEGVRGREAEELTAAANEADLMVLGSRGLGGVLGFVSGSVSSRSPARHSGRSYSCGPGARRRLPTAGSWRAWTSTTRVNPCWRSRSRRRPGGASLFTSCTSGNRPPPTGATWPLRITGAAKPWRATRSAASTICWRHGGDGTPAWTSQPAWRWDPPRTRSRRRHGTRNSWLWDDGHAGSPA